MREEEEDEMLSKNTRWSFRVVYVRYMSSGKHERRGDPVWPRINPLCPRGTLK